MTLTNTITNLSQYWELLFPGAPLPSSREWALWLVSHDEATVRKALLRMAQKYEPGRTKTEHLPKFVMGVLNRIEQETATAKKQERAKSTVGDSDEQMDEINWNR